MLLSEKDKREVNEMCNLSEAIWDKGVSEGLERGLEQGRTAERQAFYTSLKAHIEGGSLSLEDASAIAPDSEDFLAWYKMQVN